MGKREGIIDKSFQLTKASIQWFYFASCKSKFSNVVIQLKKSQLTMEMTISKVKRPVAFASV